jgi:hypothetical protein
MIEYYYVVDGKYFGGEGKANALPTEMPSNVEVVEGKYAGGLSEYVAPELPYTAKRMRAYPAISDQLDALWKGGDALIEMQARIMAVKEKYPKE